MFLQSILQQRLQSLNEEEKMLKTGGSMGQINGLPKPKKIGSIKNNKINYPSDQNFFHSSDIPVQVRSNVKEMKELIDPDILAKRKREWNQSVFPGQKLEQSHEQNLFNVRFGLKDEKIMAPKDPFIYNGTDTREIYHDGWEVSVEIPIPREQEKKIQEDTKLMMTKTKMKNEQLVKDKYKPPHVLTKEYNEGLRKEKEEQQEIRDQFRNTVKYDMPKATESKIEAIVFRKMYEAQHIKKEPDDPELTLRPDMVKTLRNTKARLYYHNGKWEVDQFSKNEVNHSEKREKEGAPKEKKERWAWSCCMNSDKESEGCVAVVKDKQKWILSSYT